MRDGRFWIVTCPFETVIVAGNGVAALRLGEASALETSATASAKPVRNAARAKRRAMGASPSPFREGVEASGERQVF